MSSTLSTLLLPLLTNALSYVVNTQHSSYLCWQVYFAMSSTLQLPLLTGVLFYHQHSSYLCWQVYSAVINTPVTLLTGVLCYVTNTPVTFVDRCTLLCHQHCSYLCWQVYFAVINTPVTFVDKCTLLSSTLQLPLLTSVLCCHQHSNYLCWQVYFAMSPTLQLPLLTSALCYVINTPGTFVDKCTLLCHQHSIYLCWQVHFAMSSTLQVPLLTSAFCCVFRRGVGPAQPSWQIRQDSRDLQGEKRGRLCGSRHRQGRLMLWTPAAQILT